MPKTSSGTHAYCRLISADAVPMFWQGSRKVQPERNPCLLFFEHVFVLRVSNGQSSLRSRADYKLKADRPRYNGDEGNGSIRILARADFAFPFPKIKDRRRSGLAHGNVPEGRICVMPRELRTFGRIRRNRDQLALGCEAREKVLGVRFQLGIRFRTSVEENFEQFAAEAVANHPPGVTVRENHRTHILVGEPDHVAVISDEVAAMVNDGDAVGGIDLKSHTVGNVLADIDLGSTALEQGPFGDIRGTIRQFAVG